MAVREEQVAQALKFLEKMQTSGRSAGEKEQFLASKGLTSEEVGESFKRLEQGSSVSGGQGGAGGASGAPGGSVPGAEAIWSGFQGSPPAASPRPPAAPTAQAPSGQASSAALYAPPATAAAPPAPAPAGYAAEAAHPWQPPGQPPAGYGGYPAWAAQVTSPPSWGPLVPPPPSDSSGSPWWAWLLGGLGTGLGATLLLDPLSLRSGPSQGKPSAADARWPSEAATAAPVPPAARGYMRQPALPWAPLEPSAAAETGGTAASVPGTPAEELDGKAAYEDLLAKLRQQSEEMRENSALCARAIQAMQDQFQQQFTEMQKVLQLSLQQPKPSKPQPTELSAATIQALAALLRPAQPSESDSAGDGGPVGLGPTPSSPASSGAGGGGGLRESFEVINLNLQRLLREASTKLEVGKSLSTLCMILQNVLSPAAADRQHKVNTTSSRFKDLFGSKGAAAELLKAAGFQYQEPNFILAQEQGIEAVQRVLDLIQDMQRNLDQAWGSRPPDASVEPPPPAAVLGSAASSASAAEDRPATPWPAAAPAAELPGPPPVGSGMPWGLPMMPTAEGMEGSRPPWAAGVTQRVSPPPWAAPAPRQEHPDSAAGEARPEEAAGLPPPAGGPPGPETPVVAHPAESQAPRPWAGAVTQRIAPPWGTQEPQDAAAGDGRSDEPSAAAAAAAPAAGGGPETPRVAHPAESQAGPGPPPPREAARPWASSLSQRNAAPWASQVARQEAADAAAGDSRPEEVAGAPAVVAPAAAAAAVLPPPGAPGAETPAVAHPAESQVPANPSAVAHPAESRYV